MVVFTITGTFSMLRVIILLRMTTVSVAKIAAVVVEISITVVTLTNRIIRGAMEGLSSTEFLFSGLGTLNPKPETLRPINA